MSTPSSPCIGVCTIDERHALCLGCGRTLAEIAVWVSLSEQQRRALMAELPARLAAQGGPALDAEASHP